MLWWMRRRTILLDGGLLLLASSCGLLSVIRERVLPDDAASMAMAGATPAAAAHALIAAKAALALLLFLAVLISMRRKREGLSLPRALAGSPAVRTSIVAGAAIALGLAAFDACTGYHGAAMDSTGACHCWVTALLAAVGALAAGIAVLAGRTIVAFARNLVRVVVRLVLQLRPRAGWAAMPRQFRESFIPYRRRRFARRTAGRAPPQLA